MSNLLNEFQIKAEPRGQALEDLLDYCAAVGSSCSLVDRFPSSKKGRDAREQFLQLTRAQIMGIEAATSWPGTSGQSPVRLMHFSLNSELVALLLAAATGLYRFRSPDLPEDFAVYRDDGSVLLGTVAHEHMGWMLLSAAERADKRLGLVELVRTRV